MTRRRGFRTSLRPAHPGRRAVLAGLAAGLGVALVRPGLLWAEDAFDLAIEGQNLMAAGKNAEAVEVLTKATTLDPESDFAWGLLGMARYHRGELREALEAFKNAARINPDDTYSRMMIERISQKPLPPKPPEAKPLSPLEQKAKAEEQAMADELKARSGLGYRIGRVVLDAGHGGFDSGAVGPSKLLEKDLTLDLAKRTATVLGAANAGLKLFFTRTDDYYVPLSARTTIANQYRADLFLSFHINANQSPKPHGMETYFCSEDASSKEAERVAEFENSVLKYDEQELTAKGYLDIEDILFRFERRRYWQAGDKAANVLQDGLVKGLPMHNRGVQSANFYVLRRARMPSILLETGFISNPENEALLQTADMRQKIAQSIAQGVLALKDKGV